MLEQRGPADRAEDKAEIDAADAESDFAPVGLGQLCAEDAKLEVEFLLSPDKERYQRGQDDQAQYQLFLLQAFSVSIGDFIVWPGLFREVTEMRSS